MRRGWDRSIARATTLQFTSDCFHKYVSILATVWMIESMVFILARGKSFSPQVSRLVLVPTKGYWRLLPWVKRPRGETGLSAEIKKRVDVHLPSTIRLHDVALN